MWSLLSASVTPGSHLPRERYESANAAVNSSEGPCVTQTFAAAIDMIEAGTRAPMAMAAKTPSSTSATP
jgi:hypothetical protein